MFVSAYADSLYATQLQASTQATGSSRCRLLGDCERQLLSDAVAVPLFAQQHPASRTSSLTPLARCWI